MSRGLKRDADQIALHLAALKGARWLGAARAWWPDYLFRADPIEHAAGILNDGKLLSRATAASAGLIQHDSASPGVIGSTADRWKHYVRLYFRPRSPTQSVSEGFRPKSHYEYGAHCPVPVVFMFDAREVLSRGGTEFSNGNLASRDVATGRDAAFLKSVPFDLVYHDGAFSQAEKAKIIFHRHAEAMVPGELDLRALRFVGCRTQAEYETLLHLLTPQAKAAWSKKIGLGAKGNLHYRRWNYVEQVTLDSKSIRFGFNPSPTVRGPFHARAELVEQKTNKLHYWERKSLTLAVTLDISLKNVAHPERYEVRLTLDERLAYANRFFEDVPF